MLDTELIIFDCDGVLVDSEIVAARVEAEMLRQAGHDITAEDIAAARGQEIERVRAWFKQSLFTPKAAVEDGLIDRVAFFDQFKERPTATKDDQPAPSFIGAGCSFSHIPVLFNYGRFNKRPLFKSNILIFQILLQSQT